MAAEDTIREGRTPFEIRPDKEYSGLTIADRYLERADLEKTFFNGVVLTNCWFDSVRLNDTELSEAKFEYCRFNSTNLSGCDFVDSIFKDVIFAECSFVKGEWRDATFLSCRFIDCDFIHTTVTLCTFVACTFDSATWLTIQHRGVYFNIFTRSSLPAPVSDPVFAARNFGPPATGIHGQMVSAELGLSIEQMCLLNNLGHFRVVSLVDVATSICSSLAGEGYRRSSALTFFSKVLRTLTDERRISATSLMYLEQLITSFGASIQEQDLLMAAMSAVVEIHSALLSIASERAFSQGDEHDRVTKVTIVFSGSYQRRQAEVLREALAAGAGAVSEALTIDGIQSGSTIIDLASASIVSVGALLVGVNFVLRQATVTVEHTARLKRAVKKLRQTPAKKSSGRTLAVIPPSQVTAILQPDAAVPELARIREAVRRHGRVLIELDERAEVKILAEQADRG